MRKASLEGMDNIKTGIYIYIVSCQMTGQDERMEGLS
jgi:hypothetical protein